jgi:hypothetical protein
MEINVSMDYELSINGDVVDRSEDVDTLMSLLTNVDDFWISSDKESDNHFIQAGVTTGISESLQDKYENHYHSLEHWKDGTQIIEVEDVDVSVANKLVKAFLEKDYDSIKETADSLLKLRGEVGEDTFCTNCGSKLTPEQRFCPSCGEKNN